MKKAPDASDRVWLKRFFRLSRPMRAYFRPRFFGMDNIDPDKPSLFVGNHPLFALDYPLMAAELYEKKGIVLHPLGDHWHFRIPIWRFFMSRIGTVDGTPENCSRLMDAGEHIVVFPGGAREAFKRKREAHKLIWKNRTGFARLAIKHGFRIIPFASKGADHVYSILLDGRDVMASPLGRFLNRTGIAPLIRNGEMIPPLVRGVGPTLLPRPERFFFAFGEPIETRRFQGAYQDRQALLALRREVEESLKTQIGILLYVLGQDRDDGYLRRLLNRL
jgi:1-acyl-sn-glycerol-3-phosphate acyltransferase